MNKLKTFNRPKAVVSGYEGRNAQPGTQVADTKQEDSSLQFERIEEQLREESPTKSERRRDDHLQQQKEATLTEESSHRSNFQIRPQEVQQNDGSSIDPKEFDIVYPEEYHNDDYTNATAKTENTGADGKVQRMYLNGKKEVIFANGVRRETFLDGYTIVYFKNGDIKQTYPDQRIVYYFRGAETTQTTLSTGL